VIEEMAKKEVLAPGTIISAEELRKKIQPNVSLWKALGEGTPKDPLGNPLGVFKVGAEYTVDPATITELKDVAPASYWER
jgi:hypothetical protein